MVFMRGTVLSREASLSWLDPSGLVVEEIPDKDKFFSVVLSPDERFIAMTVRDARETNRDLWIYEIERGFRNRFTQQETDEGHPVWSPDGRFLYYVADPDGSYKVYRKAVSGIRSPELVFDFEAEVRIWDISPDGELLLYSLLGEGGNVDLWVTALDGTQDPRVLVQTAATDGAAKFSPDGKWISYYSTETGTGQVYLAPWPDMEWSRRVSTTTGAWQFWLDDGRTLVFQDGNSQVLSASIEGEGENVKIGVPVQMFAHNGMTFDGPYIDVTGDGEKFIAVGNSETNPPGHFEVILNWSALLPER